jgi:hypothetical protein
LRIVGDWFDALAQRHRHLPDEIPNEDDTLLEAA